MKLLRETDKYIFQCTFHEKDMAKAARFRWNPENKEWWTKDIDCALRLKDYASPELKAELEQIHDDRRTTLEKSRAKDADIKLPTKGNLKYYPFQKAGVKFILDKMEKGAARVILGDEVGLGKTCQSIAPINLRYEINNILIIAPKSLLINWYRELNMWLLRDLSIGIATTKECPETDIVIVNYDIFSRRCYSQHRIKERIWDYLIIDEHQKIKGNSKRTYNILGRNTKKNPIEPIQATHVAALSGTSVLAKPVELWPILHFMDPDTWNSYWHYTGRWCSRKQTRWGLDVSGASNLDELNSKLRSTCLFRRTKAEVLPDLPPKIRQVIELPQNGAEETVQAELSMWQSNEDRLAELKARVELSKASSDPEEYKRAVDALREGMGVAFSEIAKVRHDTAVAKIPHVIEHAKDAVEASDKVVIFAHHHDVVDGLMEGLKEYNPMPLTGREDSIQKQAAIDRLQKDPNCKVFIGSITAAGVGITLTASSHIIFAELDWTPANITQAEGRCLRIGQKNTVLVQHLVFDESLDARMAKIIVEKQAIVDAILDDDVPLADPIPVLPIDKDVATNDVTPEKIEKEIPHIDSGHIKAIHAGLRVLTAMDGDRARQVNGAGWSKIDSPIGHSLSEQNSLTPKQAVLGRRLLQKYRRQVDSELLTQAGII